MRRIATWLLVGAVAALGIAAAVDAMRGTEQVSRQRAGPLISGLADQPERAVRQLREAGVRGVLTYSDEECKLHAVSLPDLRPVRAPSFEMCRPAMASGGLGTVDGDVVWAGLGYGTFQVVLSKEELGREWLEPQLFRFGASSLLTDIERQLEMFVTGRYAAAHRHPMP